jgi:hypothetical protein
MSQTPSSIVQFLVEDAFYSLLGAAQLSDIDLYRTADSATEPVANDRCEVLSGDSEPEFPDAPPDSQAAANIIVPLSLVVITNVAARQVGGVDVDQARQKHVYALGKVQDAALRDDLLAQLRAQNVPGLHIGQVYWSGMGRPEVTGNRYRTEIRYNVHACAV